MDYPITLDGVTYENIRVISLKRSFAVLDGENAGRTMTGEMDRDVIGTFYNYACEVDSDDADIAEYDAFYEAISAPVDNHVLTVPYGQSLLTFDAYISNGEDELISMEPTRNKWGNLAFNFLAMAPERTPA